MKEPVGAVAAGGEASEARAAGGVDASVATAVQWRQDASAQGACQLSSLTRSCEQVWQ